MKSINLSRPQWTIIRAELLKQYPLSTCTINRRMKEVLGFTLRTSKYYIDECYLDFYSESKRSWFLLRFSSYIEE